MPVIINGETNVGKIRTNNEDSLIAEPIWDGTHYLAVVIDGVGGYEGGEVAAKIATEKIKEYLITDAKGETATLLREAVVFANAAIYNERKNDRKYSEMCCVLTACIIDMPKQQIYMAHVGDTRLYVFYHGVLKKLSHDHSLVGYREEIGDLSEAEAMEHPQRNVVSRNVGSDLHKVDDENFIESAVFDIEGDSMYLLCSDGLNDMITSQEITRCLTEEGSVKKKCSKLIQAALDAGGKDNVTVVLAHILPEVKTGGTKVITDAVPPKAAAPPQSASPGTGPASQKQTQDPGANKKPIAVATPKRKRSTGAYIAFLFVGMLLGGAGVFFAIAWGKFPAINNLLGVSTKDTAKPIVNEGDSLYIRLNSAQKAGKHTFSFASKDSVIKIDRPLVIYADSFEWAQPSVLHIRPADSTACPIGLIVRGRDVRFRNIYFGHFAKDTIDIGSSNITPKPQGK